jgi:hypothetical protein
VGIRRDRHRAGACSMPALAKELGLSAAEVALRVIRSSGSSST